MKRASCRHPRAERGFGMLIELIIVVAIIMAGVAMYTSMSSDVKDASRALDAPDRIMQNRQNPGQAGGPGGGMREVSPDRPGNVRPGVERPVGEMRGNRPYGGMRDGRPGNGTLRDGRTDRPQSVPGMAVDRARGVQCEENLRELRALIESAKAESPNGTYPPSLDAIPDAREVSRCSIDGSPYQYNPATGQVHCTYPGHEQF